MVPDLLPVAVSVKTVVAEVVMEKFVLVPEACPVVSMTSTVVRTFGPGSGRVRYSASVCPADGRVRYSSSVCPAIRQK